MLNTSIIKGLELILDNIKTGNSNISEEEALDLLKSIQEISNTSHRISKYSALKLLGVSRATFDLYVRKGKIPKGIKAQGFKELSWEKHDILKIKRKMKEGSF